MKINVNNAANLFFPNPSLELVYFESIANSIDAGATEIRVKIKLSSFAKPDELQINITDNGEGFNDKNFRKFSNLLEVEEEDHKGIGRLVFLKYFKEVEIKSCFDDKIRSFSFHGKFDGECELTDNEQDIPRKTILTFKKYFKDRIKAYAYVRPEAIVGSLLTHFFPLFYAKKLKQEKLKIIIELETQDPNSDHGFFSDVKQIDINQLPNLEEIIFKDDRLTIIDDLHLYYSIEEHPDSPSLITALSVDGRTIPLKVLSSDNLPSGYRIIFLLFSDYFKGKVNSSRQELTINRDELKVVTRIFEEKIAELLNDNIPLIKERITTISEGLNNRFPHLQGYFDEKSVGIIDRSKSLERAQSRFFKDQKEILEASSLSSEQYEKSLELSARLLMEYILYRNIIINKLKDVDETNSEDEIHDIIIPMKKTYKEQDFIEDLYTNNAWLLDDKYMTYNTILSDEHMDKLIVAISSPEEQVEPDKNRPDIAMVFSGNPETTDKVDVVIVELKKLGLGLADKETVVSQLRQRARKLLAYYPSKIQRIWFYGIVDIDVEFERSLLEDKFAALYSSDKVFYKEQPIIIDMETKEEIPVGVYVLSFEAFLRDAENRNSTFLNLLKESFKKKQ